jgi:hypothetical protein
MRIAGLPASQLMTGIKPAEDTELDVVLVYRGEAARPDVP